MSSSPHISVITTQKKLIIIARMEKKFIFTLLSLRDKILGRRKKKSKSVKYTQKRELHPSDNPQALAYHVKKCHSTFIIS